MIVNTNGPSVRCTRKGEGGIITGRPPKRWKDQVAHNTSLQINELKEIAMDRYTWKDVIKRSKPFQA